MRCFQFKYPDVKITFVTKKNFTPLFDEFKGVDLLYLDSTDKHSGLRGLYALYRDIKQLKPTGIVDLHGSLRTTVLRFFSFFRLLDLKKFIKAE